MQRDLDERFTWCAARTSPYVFGMEIYLDRYGISILGVPQRQDLRYRLVRLEPHSACMKTAWIGDRTLRLGKKSRRIVVFSS
jgi:hypothetical protein